MPTNPTLHVFVRNKYTTFTYIGIVALRSVYKIFQESHDFAAKLQSTSVWNQSLLYFDHLILLIIYGFTSHSRIFTQALGGLESFITVIGHRFPKFYNASLYGTFLKCNF
jgi:hypothetical protein